jgi:hypothetical protein
LRSSRDKDIAKVRPVLKEDIVDNPALIQKISDRSQAEFEAKKALLEKKNASPTP